MTLQDSALQDSDDQIAAVRAFNRFYTRKLGVLDQHHLAYQAGRGARHQCRQRRDGRLFDPFGWNNHAQH